MTKPSLPNALWIGLLGLISLGLRVWHLGRFNELVFDEIYYVSFALDYLNQTPSFDAHPPLGKYLIALGSWLASDPANWLHWPRLVVDGQTLSPVSFRWMNSLFGATLPLLVAALAYQLGRGYEGDRRWRFCLLAGSLMVLEGLTLVESRLALINLYWLWFGLLGQVCWLAPKEAKSWTVGWRLAAGVALGASVNVKWNGAGFWLGLVLWELAAGRENNGHSPRSGPGLPGKKLPWPPLLIYLGLVPIITYGLLWLPHLRLTGESFATVHANLWQAHQTIAADDAPHPYCSAWYTWPLMLRPVAYFHKGVGGTDGGAMLAPYRAYGDTIFTIQSMGNPALWWLSTASVLGLGLSQIGRWRTRASQSQSLSAQRPNPGHFHGEGRSFVAGFILINYLANWLPWMLVSRCTFLYHALGMVIFSALALAWLLARWLDSRYRFHRLLAWMMLGIIALSFWFWLPVFLGSPLSPEALQRRWWLPSWI
ncbi:MAG: phospholipid carrier-dependent glycosyltransferase [Leptolyngbyaceae cyanobacterium SM2_5_2]|nr:phospholipid carrier-dependent glycosyltransferase [Leptolyngbyaceae cyanobacterium SM2_5_2]